MTRLCQHCGMPLDAVPPLVIDDEEGLVSRGERVVYLTSSERSVLQALDEARPRPVSPSALDAVIPSRRPARRLVFALRGKLDTLGLRIERVGRAGYRLAERRPGGAS